MATTPLLAPIGDLATLLRLELDEEDAYATLILRGASNAVRTEARQPGWRAWDDEPALRPTNPDPADLSLTWAPEVAADVTLQVAARAYTNPENLQRRTSGPSSDSWFENGLYGLELSAADREKLRHLRPDGGGDGVWTLPIAYGDERYGPIMVPSSPPNLGDVYLADEGQFPYGQGPTSFTGTA